jgi:hypothetical protein
VAGQARSLSEIVFARAESAQSDASVAIATLLMDVARYRIAAPVEIAPLALLRGRSAHRARDPRAIRGQINGCDLTAARKASTLCERWTSCN